MEQLLQQVGTEKRLPFFSGDSLCGESTENLRVASTFCTVCFRRVWSVEFRLRQKTECLNAQYPVFVS